MKKISVALLIVLMMALCVSIPAVAAGGSPDNFKVVNTYSSGQFKDLAGASWYSMNVQACYEYGLMCGVSSDSFAPGRSLTIAEAIKLASCLSSIYAVGSADFEQSAVWYDTYVDYALKNGIIDSQPGDYSAPVTRAEFADMISKALPSSAFAPTCSIGDGAIPDVSSSDSFSASIYQLYRAGVLTGCDKFGTFRPNGPLSRAEAAAIAVRASDKNFRKSLTLPNGLSGEEIFANCSPAVFYLQRYDSEGVLIGIGSGFFISSDGLAVTNYHVIADAASATITTSDNKQYDVKGICGYDKTKDIAVLQIKGSGFSYLNIANSDQVQIGTPIYAIGSPFGLINTISNGIISNAAQSINNSSFIQYSAPISMGSGGGPILDTKGQVVGVTCLTVTAGQTINFAVPINDLSGLSRSNSVPLITLAAKNAGSIVFYKNYYPVPDYGMYIGTPVYKTSFDRSTGVKTYYYKLSDITAGDAAAVSGYIALLAQYGFKWQISYKSDSGNTVDVYHSSDFNLSVNFGVDNLDGVACRFVAIYTPA